NALIPNSLASCVPVGNRHARRLPIAAQDAILPHRNRTFLSGRSTTPDFSPMFGGIDVAQALLRHSCLPHSCRRLPSTLCHARAKVSRRVSTRQARAQRDPCATSAGGV